MKKTVGTRYFLSIGILFCVLAQAAYPASHSGSEPGRRRTRLVNNDETDSAGRQAAALWCATDGPNGDRAFDLETFRKRKTFYEVMKEENRGIKAAIDRDYEQPFRIAKADEFRQYANAFAPQVLRKVFGLFAEAEQGIGRLLGKLAVTRGNDGQLGVFTPASFRAALRKVLNENSDLLTKKAAAAIPLTAAKIAPLIAIASGSGLIVRIDDGDCYINYGYASGAKDGDEKSGRSFDVSLSEAALDPSDIEYLKSLGMLLDPDKDSSGFYRAMFQMLTRTDTTGFSKLNPLARKVLSRWAAIYAAEHDRWLMSDEKAHDWQNALTEATLLAPYVTASGKVYFNGKLSDGDPTNFFGVGSVGSGLGGRLGIQRRRFQALVTAALRSIPGGRQAVEKVEAVTGPQHDIFKGIMKYLNSADTDQSEVRASADELSEAVVDLTEQLKDHAREITKYLRDQE